MILDAILLHFDNATCLGELYPYLPYNGEHALESMSIIALVELSTKLFLFDLHSVNQPLPIVYFCFSFCYCLFSAQLFIFI